MVNFGLADTLMGVAIRQGSTVVNSLLNNYTH